MTVADGQNMPGIPTTSTSSTNYAKPLPTSPSPPEGATTIYSNSTQGNTTQADGESPPIASQINPRTSGAVAIEGSDAGPQDATELGSSGPNKIDLWGKALSQIQQSQDKKSAEMVEIFVQTLNDPGSDASGSYPFRSAKDIQKQMQESIAGKEAKTESDGWIITIGQKEYHVREYVEKTTVILEKFAGTVSKFMGAVDVAVSFDLAHAALPWAAVRIIKVWDAENGSLKYTLEGYERPVTTVALSADNNLIASISPDYETVKVWDTANGSVRYTTEYYNGIIHSVTFLAEDKLIAIGLSNGTVIILDAANGSFKYRFKSRRGTLAAFSADSKLIATISIYFAIEIRDAANGLIKFTLKRRFDLINSVAFSADNKLIASASDNKTVKVWDIKEGKVKKTIYIGEDYKHLSFSNTNLLMLQEPGHLVMNPMLQRPGHIAININTIPENGEAQVVVQNCMIMEPGANDLPEIKPTSQHTVVLRPHGCSLSLEAEWVMWNGQKVVWLPPDCRPTPNKAKSYTISPSGEMIAIGSSSGRLWLMGGFEARRAQC